MIERQPDRRGGPSKEESTSGRRPTEPIPPRRKGETNITRSEKATAVSRQRFWTSIISSPIGE